MPIRRLTDVILDMNQFLLSRRQFDFGFFSGCTHIAGDVEVEVIGFNLVRFRTPGITFNYHMPFAIRGNNIGDLAVRHGVCHFTLSKRSEALIESNSSGSLHFFGARIQNGTPVE